MSLRLLLLVLSLLSVSCAPVAPSPYEQVKTEWDDVGAALKCDPADPAQNCLEPTASTVRIDDEVRLAFSGADFDETTGTLTLQLKPGAKLDSRIKEGAILYRGRKDRKPLLHRVEKLQVEGQTVRAKLVRAMPKDAFKRGRLRARLPLSGMQSATNPLTGVKEQPLQLAIGPADCSGVVFDKPLAAVGVTGNVKLDLTKCKFQLTAWVDAILEWDSFANVDKVEVTVGGSIDASLHSQLVMSLTAQYGEKKRIWEGPEIPFTIAGLVITVNPSLFAGYSLTAKATLTSLQGFDLTDSIEVGFGYSDVRDWYSIDKRTSTFTKYGPTVTVDGNITAKAFIEPRLDLKAFGFVGGSVTLEGFAEAKVTSTATTSGGTYSGQVCASLDLGMTPKIGAVAELAGVQLFSEYVDLITVRTHVVTNQCTAYTGPVPSDCDLASPCCTDGQCPTPTEKGVSVQCKKGTQLTSGKYRYSCENLYPSDYCVPGSSTTATVCNDSESLTIDSCDVDTWRCVHTLRGADLEVKMQPSPTSSIDTCRAPCCFSDADCADGVPVTRNVCSKPFAGPSIKGTCVIE